MELAPRPVFKHATTTGYHTPTSRPISPAGVYQLVPRPTIVPLRSTSPIGPVVVPPRPASPVRPLSPTTFKREDDLCCVCFDNGVPQHKALGCGHYVCMECTGNLRRDECPTCRAGLIGGYAPEYHERIIAHKASDEGRLERANAEYAANIAAGMSDTEARALYDTQI